jgi:hypothetical protein
MAYDYPKIRKIMINQRIPRYQLPKIITATIIAVGSTLTAVTSAKAVPVNISIENLGPEGGAIATPLWVTFHDGSFDAFDPGAPASSGIELMSEDGLAGLEDPNIIPDFPSFKGTAFEDVDKNFPIPKSQSIAGLFRRSAASRNGGVQSLVFAPNNPAGVLPGQSGTRELEIGDPTKNRFFNFASMYFASNDALIANDEPIKIFDKEGNFIGADLIYSGNQVWDAGTEINDESLLNVPYSTATVGNGVDENGVITGPHDPFKPAGSGGILDFKNNIFDFSNSDPTTPGYQVARIRVTQASENLGNSASVPEPSWIGGLVASGGLLLWLRSRIIR